MKLRTVETFVRNKKFENILKKMTANDTKDFVHFDDISIGTELMFTLLPGLIFNGHVAVIIRALLLHKQ